MPRSKNGEGFIRGLPDPVVIKFSLTKYGKCPSQWSLNGPLLDQVTYDYTVILDPPKRTLYGHWQVMSVDGYRPVEGYEHLGGSLGTRRNRWKDWIREGIAQHLGVDRRKIQIHDDALPEIAVPV